MPPLPLLRVGLVFELLGSRASGPGEPPDADVEYEPERTIAALEAALRRLGHEPVRLGSPEALWARAGKGELPQLDAALNIAEGHGSRNREAWAPVLLELLGVPTLGSDALTLSTTLDKLWAKRAVAAAGIPVAPGCALASADAVDTAVLPPYPLFVKPRWEGTAKGIGPGSRVEDRAALVREVTRVVAAYRQPALVEQFLPGAEYTVTLVGGDPPEVLPVLQRALEQGSGIGIHALERHAPPAGGAWTPHTPGRLDPECETRLAAHSRAIWDLFECRDFARLDFKEDANGEPRFLEINPLPTFDPEGSFGILAELAGRQPEALLADVLERALRRVRAV